MITCYNVFNVWPKTALLLPVWPRDAKRLDSSGEESIVCPIKSKSSEDHRGP